MPENKFDLSKALQAAKLYTKIDYGNLILDMQQRIKNFENWGKDHGYKTEEEKQEDLKAEMQAAQQRFNEQGLWNSEDPYEVYNAYQTDPAKQAEFQRNGEMVAGIGGGIATLPFTAGAVGWVPAITTTVTGAAGGYAGAHGGQKLGQYLDNKYGWNTTPWLSTAGGLFGTILGGGLGYKGLVKAGSAGLLKGSGQMYGKQFVKDAIDDISKTTLNKLKQGPLRHYRTFRMTPSGSNTEVYEIHLYDTLTGKDVGQLSTSTFKNSASTANHIVGTPYVKGKGRDLYSAAWSKNPNGVISGERLVSPHQTIPTWEHFDYDVLGYHGSHGVSETGGKVVRLKYPERILPEVDPKVIEYVPK